MWVKYNSLSFDVLETLHFIYKIKMWRKMCQFLNNFTENKEKNIKNKQPDMN